MSNWDAMIAEAFEEASDLDAIIRRPKTQVVGIDPGVHTGFAWIKDGQIMDVSTRDFWDTFFQVQRFLDPTQTVLVIEAGGLNSPTFHKADSWAAQNKTSQRVGSANREADLLAIGFEKCGFEVVRVRPSKSKWDAATCQQITGWKARTSQHARDAIRLAWEHWQTLKLQRRIKQ